MVTKINSCENQLTPRVPPCVIAAALHEYLRLQPRVNQKCHVLSHGTCKWEKRHGQNVKATFSPRVLSKNSKLAEVQVIKHFLSEKNQNKTGKTGLKISKKNLVFSNVLNKIRNICIRCCCSFWLLCQSFQTFDKWRRITRETLRFVSPCESKIVSKIASVCWYDKNSSFKKLSY